MKSIWALVELLKDEGWQRAEFEYEDSDGAYEKEKDGMITHIEWRARDCTRDGVFGIWNDYMDIRCPEAMLQVDTSRKTIFIIDENQENGVEFSYVLDPYPWVKEEGGEK